MKSIVEEASSIKQAIENGWKRLGEPTIFSIKILEKPETGFFGFNTKSAKVALIVEDKMAPSQLGQQFKNEPTHKQPSIKKAHPSTPHHQEKQVYSSENAEESMPKWSEQRVALVKEWITQVLRLIGRERCLFELIVTDATLNINFKSPLHADAKNERFLCASIGHLVMETLRNKSKKMMRNMRIVVTS